MLPRLRSHLLITALLATSLAVCAALPPRTPPADPQQALLDDCPAVIRQDPRMTLPCYRARQATIPLRYEATGSDETVEVKKRSYVLNSQSWSSQGLVSPADWRHDVDIYIPAQARHQRALLVINNGARSTTKRSGPQAPTDFSEAVLAAVASKTQTVVISVSDAPSQPLVYADDGKPRPTMRATRAGAAQSS